MRRSFESAGLVYNPNPDVVPNTMRALRITELARDQGVHREVHDRLMAAYWDEAQNIGDAEVLVALAVEAGLDRGQVEEVLGADGYRDRVRASTAQAHRIGINGIPAFLLDGRLLVLGAQPRDVFERAFERLAAADGPATEGASSER